MSPLLEIEDLAITLGGQTPTVLLDGVSLAVREGESVALVGESGSGKSLTVRSVLRLLPQDATTRGDIRFAGESILAMDPERLSAYRRSQAAMIFQDPRAAINPVRTVGDFLVEGLRTSRGLTRSDATTEAVRLLQVVGISHPGERLDQHPHQFSGGMLQRVMIAGAVGSGARLLLADEPTTALDVSIQAEIMGLLAELTDTLGLAVIFVTHDIDLAVATCSRIEVMYAGHIIESRVALDLHESPWHPYSAALISSRPLVDHRVGALRAIGGQPATADESHQRCAFAPRCTFAESTCWESKPEATNGPGGYVRCWRAEAIRADLSAVVHPAPEEIDEPSSQDVIVEVRDLRKTFHLGGGQDLTAVDGVSLRLRRGECLGIVGESGSGKSTLAKLLLGIEVPDSGAIEVDGEARGTKARSSKQRRHWGSQLQIVFQDPFTSLDPRQTATSAVDEVLALHAPDLSRDQRAERVDALLSSVGIEGDKRVALPVELSGGQRQRVAIAKALAAHPQAIILDEAVSGLDVSIQAQVLNLLADLQRASGIAYLFISHDLAVIRQAAHRVVVMKDGRVVEEGPTSRVLDNPQHEYTRRLRDAAPRADWAPPRSGGIDTASD